MTHPKWQAGQKRTYQVIQPVINVPPSTVVVQPQPPVASLKPPKPTTAARAWSVAKVAGPVIASGAAIVISLLSYTDQHSSDSLQAQQQKAASAAAVRHDAQQVSWYIDSHGNVTMVNATVGVINRVVFIFGPDLISDRSYSLGEVPSCSAVTVSTNHFLFMRIAIANYYYQWPIYLVFQDRDGRYWLLSDFGVLRRAPRGFLKASQDSLDIPPMFITTRSSTVCS